MIGRAIRYFILLFIISLSGYLIIEGRNMQVITTEIEISAPPEKVWTILADINKWHEWSPIINKSSGEFSEGAHLNITMMGKQTGEDGPQYKPTLIKLVPNEYLSWSAKMMAGFIFTNGKIIELTKTEDGTKLVHKETFKGLMAPLMCGQMETSVPPMLKMMNLALKKLAEK